MMKCPAQSKLLGSFNSTHAGRSLLFDFSKSKKSKSEFGVGIRFNIGQLAHSDDQNNVYKKRLFPTTSLQYWGLHAFYKRHVLESWIHVHPYLFYDLQATWSTTRNRMLLPYTSDFNGDLLYKEYVEFFGPFTWIEQNVGIGFRADLSKNWFIDQKIGFGTCFILGYDKTLLDKSFNWFESEFGGIITLGVGYRFNSEK